MLSRRFKLRVVVILALVACTEDLRLLVYGTMKSGGSERGCYEGLLNLLFIGHGRVPCCARLVDISHLDPESACSEPTCV